MKKYFSSVLIFCCITTVYGQTLPLPQLVKKIENSVFTVLATDKNGKEFSQGSGFVIESNGVCITNFHVLENAQGGYVQNKNGEKFSITKVIDYNANCDLVKFKIDNKGRQFYALPLSMTKPQKGEEIVSLSTPIGLEQTLSNGIVSSIRETELYGTVIQMTAPISHGSSGSPVLNRKGEVLGVSTFGYEEGQSLNFAVSTLNFSKINKIQNINLQDITRDPLETPNIKKARAAILEGNYEKVFELTGIEFKKDPTNHLALFLTGQALFAVEEFESAANVFSNAIVLAPEIANYYNFCGLAIRRLGDIKFKAGNHAPEEFMSALQFYDKAISLENDPNYYYNKGRLIFELYFTYRLLNSSVLYDAMNDFNNSIQLDPYSEMSYVGRAEVKQNLSDYWGTISDCDRAIAINPYYYRSYQIRGDTKGYFLEDYQAGIKDLDVALSLVETDRERADILGLKGTQSSAWAFKIMKAEKIDFEQAIQLFNDARKYLQEAYKISGDKVYLDRLNELSTLLKKLTITNGKPENGLPFLYSEN
jgi:tetratricopeptide (TPR) repeat protein